jgi:hypothetical protein
MIDHLQDEKLSITLVSSEFRMDALGIVHTISGSFSTRVPISTGNSIEQRQGQ